MIEHCAVEGCEQGGRLKRGYCNLHYIRLRRSGDVRADVPGRELHGEGRHGQRTPEYEAWLDMRWRCSTPSYKQWKDYGGRGITVCDRWLVYSNFLADVGRRPSPLLTLDRIANDGNYEPGNVRWATRHEQQMNRRVS